jgi:hypothetical protein
MKYVFIALLLVITVFNAAAQNKNGEDSLLNLMKDDICDELGKVPASDFTKDNFQVKLGMQMMNVFQKYNDDLEKVYGDDYSTNQSKIYDIGKKIGIKLGMNCKSFQEIILSNPELANAAMKQAEKYEKPLKEVVRDAPKAEIISVFGKVISFTPGVISFYTLKTDEKTVKIYWFGKFEGDDNVIANPQAIVGKKVMFQVYEQKVYDAKEKVYKKLTTAFSYTDEAADKK